MAEYHTDLRLIQLALGCILMALVIQDENVHFILFYAAILIIVVSILALIIRPEPKKTLKTT